MLFCRHLDLAFHTCLEMAGDEASKIKIPRAVKCPDDRPGLARCHMRHVGLLVLHRRELEHQCSVVFEFFLRADDQFVQNLAAVLHHQLNGLALLDLNFIGRKAHVVAHGELDGACHGLGIASDTPFLLFFFDFGGFLMLVFAVSIGVGGAKCVR